ncbi:gamma-aminobutyric acid type B receptor subunit 2-like isoform X2 [Dysidea avara]|uniref:gamma-aminobutyric acid type B receptor subunit 2-like isoform X2 n=1 Tax=Dysidea avara TaxID=196820 RepID=UPI00333109A8
MWGNEGHYCITRGLDKSLGTRCGGLRNAGNKGLRYSSMEKRKCSSVPAMYNLIQQTDPSQPTKLMILGPACSVANIPMGEMAEKYFHLTQVSYTASSPVFGDKENYPRFFRTIPEIKQFFDGYSEVLKKMNWNRVAVIYYDDDFTLNVGLNTVQILRSNGVHVVLSELVTHGSEDHAIRMIKQVDARIIIAWPPLAPKRAVVTLWCRVIKNGLAGPDFVWLFPGWFHPSWWNVNDDECTAKEMGSSLDHSLVLVANSEVKSNLSRIIVSKKTMAQYEEELADKSTLSDVKTDVFLSVGFVYDAIWTIALALNSSISVLAERGLGQLEDFTYSSVEMADVFTEAVANVSFEGISGDVSFKEDSAQPASLQILQYQNGTATAVMIFDPLLSTDKLYSLPNRSLIWQGGYIPKDSPAPSVLTSTLAEQVIAGVLSSFGILSTIFFFSFNVYYSNHRVVKRSSYRLNSFILVGVCVGFVGTLLYVVVLDDDMPEPLTTTICNARVWSNEIAFVVTFGTLFVKIWRLYKLFFNKKLVKHRYLSDKYLFLRVAVIAIPSLVLLIVQSAVFPLTLHTITTVSEDDSSVKKIYAVCSGGHEFVFLAVTFTLHAILALFSVLLAFVTQRHIPKVGNYHKFHESAVINLTSILAIMVSSICQAIVIIFRLNDVQEGTLLLITLRDCLWMYPMVYVLFTPKVYRVKCSSVHKKFPSARDSFTNTTQVSALSLFERKCETTIINVDHDSLYNDCGVFISSDVPLATQKDVKRSMVYENKGVILSADCGTNNTYKRSLAVRSSIITNSTVLINIRLQVEDNQETSENN